MTELADAPQRPVPPVPPVPSEPATAPVVVDVLLRAAGCLLAFVGGVVAAGLAVLLVPLRVGSFGGLDSGGVWSWRIPAAIVLAVAGNLFLVWFARRSTGLRWAALLPGVGWFATVLVAMRTTTEGDRLMMPNDWVGTVTLFGGTVVLVIATVLAVTSPGRRPEPVTRVRPAG